VITFKFESARLAATTRLSWLSLASRRLRNPTGRCFAADGDIRRE